MRSKPAVAVAAAVVAAVAAVEEEAVVAVSWSAEAADAAGDVGEE